MFPVGLNVGAHQAGPADSPQHSRRQFRSKTGPEQASVSRVRGRNFSPITSRRKRSLRREVMGEKLRPRPEAHLLVPLRRGKGSGVEVALAFAEAP